MWSPTHVQVTIQKAKDLLIKGNNGTNNSFVTIAVGKEKYQTSIKEKEGKDVQWHEQCELLIPHSGNTASIVLTVLHRNGLGIDEFLGQVDIPLSSFDVYERPKSRWYKLHGKPGKEKGKDKERGELEVRIGFTVKASTGSLMDLSKKEKFKTSLGQLSNKVTGSLLSLNTGDKGNGIKQIAKSISKKVSKKKRHSIAGDEISFERSKENVSSNVDPGVISEDEDEFTFDNLSHKSSATSINQNPGLENLAGGEFLRRSSLEPTRSPRLFNRLEKGEDEWTQKLFNKGDIVKRFSSGSLRFRSNDFSPHLNGLNANEEKSTIHESALSTNNQSEKENEKQKEKEKEREKEREREREREKEREKEKENRDNEGVPVQRTKPPPLERRSLTSTFLEKQITPEIESKLSKAFQIPQFKKKDKKAIERFVVGEEVSKVVEEQSKHSKDVLRQFESKSRDDLIDMVIELQKDINRSNHHLKELEDYLDQLLLKVMETTPRILQNPYISCKTQASYNYR
ncbi:hypothetical protein RUM43_007892 [Polyplax serrata]|uniref:Uncharacterized protein n=1 Tax=Polyplax serrata TaxID=468196 RepID=A0AAN8S8U6_POLSC